MNEILMAKAEWMETVRNILFNKQEEATIGSSSWTADVE